MHVYSGNGVIVESIDKGLKLFLDPNKIVKANKNEFVAISHAHSDHLRAHKAQTLSTNPTNTLSRYDHNVLELLEYEQPINLDGFGIEALNANHILGSCQFKLTHRASDTTLIYSGDIRLQKSPLFSKPAICEADTLIIESTYGLPVFKFPEYREIKEQIEEWLEDNSSNNVIFGAYSLGKAQELVYMLNKLGYRPLVHPSIERFCKIYEEHEINPMPKETTLESLMKEELKHLGSFTCKACENFCQIERYEVGGRKFSFGGSCTRYEHQWKGTDKTEEKENYVELRNELILRTNAVGKSSRKGKIGIPRALMTHSLYPLFSIFFEELGYEVILSDIDEEKDWPDE